LGSTVTAGVVAFLIVKCVAVSILYWTLDLRSILEPGGLISD
jgi:hypothetical protein